MRQSRRSSEIVSVEGVGPQLVPDAQLVNFGDGFVGSPHVDRLPRLKAKRNTQSLDRPKKRNSFVLKHSRMVNALTKNVNTFTTGVGKLPYMTLGDRIKSARKAAKLTQQQLADAVGCERPTVTMWETNKVKKVGGEYLPALERVLRKSSDWIQTGKEAPAPRLTQEGSSDPASQELTNVRFRNSIQSLRIFVGAMTTIMASMRPDEGEAVVNMIEGEKGIDEFVNQGLGKDLLDAMKQAVRVAKARRSSRQR